MPLSTQPLRLYCRSTRWSSIPTPPLSLFSFTGAVTVLSPLSSRTPLLGLSTNYMLPHPILPPPPTPPPPLSSSSVPLMYSVSCFSPGHFLNGSYCSFEEGECSWQSITGRGLSWRRLQSPAKATRQSCPSSGGSHTSLMISSPLWLND